MSAVRSIELRSISLPLVRPFRTSFGTSTEKVCVLVRVETDDAEGWGECVAEVEPAYSEEFNEGAWIVIRDHLAPALLAADYPSIEDLDRLFGNVRGNPMAKACLIDAFIDAELRALGESVASWLGAGSSVGPRRAASPPPSVATTMPPHSRASPSATSRRTSSTGKATVDPSSSRTPSTRASSSSRSSRSPTGHGGTVPDAASSR